jgi:hypothetical protein
MAINYLNTVNLNKNSLESARIHNLGTEPTPDTPGEIYFNTTSQAIKVTVQTGFDVGSETYAWEEVGSDSVIAGTGIVITPGTGANAGNSIITNSGLIGLGVVAGSQSWSVTQSTNTTTTFVGTANEIAVDSPTPGTVRIGLPDDVTIGNDLTVTNNLSVTGEIVQTSEGNENQFASPLNMGSNKVVDLADPTDDQDAATKAYVDASTVGLLEYQGGYDANTNTPILDDRGTQIAVKKGWTYTVTADGTFYGEAVRVGDVLIAEVDLAADEGALTDWTTVQNNIDLASATQIGIGNVAAATDTSLTGVDVDYPTGSPGTAVVGFDITSLTALASSIASDTTIMPVHDTVSGINIKLTLDQLGALVNESVSFSNTGPAEEGTSYTIDAATHGLGLDSSIIMVQLVEVSSGETVYTDVTRGASGLITITFAASQAVDSFRALLQKIG